MLSHRVDTPLPGMTAQQETFEYDNLDRLTTAGAMSMSYAANGNITGKTGLGEYTYDSSKPHAVTEIENTGNLLNPRGQSIEYNALNNAHILIDTVDNDAYRLEIIYGPDGQRWKTVLQKNSSVIKTVIFAGDYEKITEDGVTRELIYLPGGAVHVKQAGQPDKVYYAHTDHLGSIVSITDGNGTEVFKASYDAWGKQIITNNTIGFHRGYTGHEHLPEFGLINMNGRMYDPIVGRFLSPDPFVQAPEFSQSYNRYSYCLNNPLIYTDPSGEWGWLAAGIGFVYGYVSHGLMNNDWGWNALGNAALTGLSWGLGYTKGVESAGMSQLFYAAQSAISSTVNSFMPSISVPVGNNFSVSTSFGLGISPGGLVAGANLSGTYHNDKFALTVGGGVSENRVSWGGGFTYDGYGAGYYYTKYGDATGPDGNPNPQPVGGVGLYFDDVSIRLENDFLAGSGDKWRSNALEVGIGNFVFGTYLYNNDPEGGKKGTMKADDPRAVDRRGNHNLHGKTAWNEGKTYRSPGYIGYRNGSNVLRLGYSHEFFQDITQNWVHRNGFPGLGWLGIGHQHFYNDYSAFQRGMYRYSGYYNPYSLYY